MYIKLWQHYKHYFIIITSLNMDIVCKCEEDGVLLLFFTVVFLLMSGIIPSTLFENWQSHNTFKLCFRHGNVAKNGGERFKTSFKALSFENLIQSNPWFWKRYFSSWEDRSELMKILPLPLHQIKIKLKKKIYESWNIWFL